MLKCFRRRAAVEPTLARSLAHTRRVEKPQCLCFMYDGAYDCVWLCNLHTEPKKYNKRCRARRIHNVLCMKPLEHCVNSRVECNSCRARSNIDYGMGAHNAVCYNTGSPLSNALLSACVRFNLSFSVLFLLLLLLLAVVVVVILSTADELCVYTHCEFIFHFIGALLCFSDAFVHTIKPTIKLSNKRDQLMLYSIFVCCCNCSLNQTFA